MDWTIMGAKLNLQVHLPKKKKAFSLGKQSSTSLCLLTGTLTEGAFLPLGNSTFYTGTTTSTRPVHEMRGIHLFRIEGPTQIGIQESASSPQNSQLVDTDGLFFTTRSHLADDHRCFSSERKNEPTMSRILEGRPKVKCGKIDLELQYSVNTSTYHVTMYSFYLPQA